MSKYSISNFYSIIPGATDEWHFDLGSFKFNYFVDWIANRPGEKYIINSMTENTPDLISYRKYGTEELYWVICLANKISDPFTELPMGKLIYIPRMSDIDEFIYSLERRTEAAKRDDRNTVVIL